MAIGFCLTLMLGAAVVGGITAGPSPSRPAAVLREWDPVFVLSISIPAAGAFVVVSAVLAGWLTRLC